jgi:hypothetical protein
VLGKLPRGRGAFNEKHSSPVPEEGLSSIVFILFYFSSILKGTTTCMGSVAECNWYVNLYTLRRADFKLLYRPILPILSRTAFAHSRPLDLFVFPCTMEQSAYNVDKIGVATPTTCASRITSPRMFSCSIKLPCISFISNYSCNT